MKEVLIDYTINRCFFCRKFVFENLEEIKDEIDNIKNKGEIKQYE